MSTIRKPKTVAFWTGRLPHWEVEDGRYFITIHLAGAIPHAGTARIRAIAEGLRKVVSRESPEWLQLQRAIFREMERWIDRADTSRLLAETAIAEMVVEAIEHRQRRGDWTMFEYVVMPSHLHLFCEFGELGMEPILKDFKRWTGHRAGAMCGVNGERFWQREWFDHWSRSEEEDERIIQYIRANPFKAGLAPPGAVWPWRGPQ